MGIIILKSPIFKSNANKYLAYAIFTLSLLLLNLVFEIVEIYNAIPYLRFIDNIEWALIFPVFVFLFIAHQVKHPIKQSKKILWLFLPFLYSAILNIFNDLDAVVNVYDIPKSFDEGIDILFRIHFYMAITFITSILIYTFTFIRNSDNVQEKKWITILWSLVFILLFSWVLAILVDLFFAYDVTPFMRLLALFATFLIHWTSYFGIYKYRLARDKEAVRELLEKRMSVYDESIVTADDDKEETNLNFSHSLTEENPYFKKLENLCKNHEIYRDSLLDREKVAEKLGISTGYLSQLVNTITGENFTTFINKYRVEAVKKMIIATEFENYSILSIGLESGFTSKTTFYKAFKKVTGMTPNSYRKTKK